MKAQEVEPRAGAELLTAIAIADRCHPDREPADPVMAVARGVIGVGLALLALLEELQQARQEQKNHILAKCECGGSSGGHPRQPHVIIL